MNQVDSEPVTVPTPDGLPLAGTRYEPEEASKGQVIVASAMATPRSFYADLAAWFADRGYSVLTFDYRGTGDSFPDNLDYGEITMEDWARRDLPGALRYATEHFPEGPRYVLAHSLSGQVIGLNGDELELDALATFSSQSGYWRLQHPNQRYRLLFASRLLFPLLNGTFGYLPWSLLFGGEDVPPRVARTWYRWCRDPDYLLGDDSLDGRENYRDFTAPILAYSFEDDEWGHPEAVDRMMEAYENAPGERIHVDPEEVDRDAIGHFGFFQSGMEPHWEDLLDRLESL